jgi:hypothetical protein
MKKILGIAVSSALILFLTMGAASAATSSKTTVYVENSDDDSLWVKFYLDGVFIKSATAYQKSTRYLGYYSLGEGPHELKIEWKDPDTCEWQEKINEINATGDPITATLSVIPNTESSCVKSAPVTKATSYGSLEVFVRNRDDDNLFTMFFIDGERRKERTIGPNTTAKFIKIHSLRPGNYTVKIRWKEPDTKEWFEKTREITVNEGSNNVTLETDELIYTHVFAKRNSSIAIIVENVDDDHVWVDVFVDSSFAIKYIRSGARGHVRTFDNLYPGTHKIWMRWIDPDVRDWQEKRFEVYVGPDEEVTETYNTTRNVYVRSY